MVEILLELEQQDGEKQRKLKKIKRILEQKFLVKNKRNVLGGSEALWTPQHFFPSCLHRISSVASWHLLHIFQKSLLR